MTEEKPDGIQTKEDGPTKLARCGLRETRAEGDTGRQEKDGRREERRGKERCDEDRQDSGVRRQKNRPAQPQARRHGPKAGIQYLFLLAQNTHRNVENRRIVQRNHASVRPRLEVDTHAFFRLVFPSEIVADSVYIDSYSSAMRCELPLGSLSLIRRNSLNVIIISVEF